jgi:hypothetical protein
MKKFLFILMAAALFTACNRVAPNFEGVLMQNYGQDRSDFSSVTGNQGVLSMGSELFQVPMYEQKGDPSEVVIMAKDNGQFAVDPTYTFEAIRGKGVEIVFNYKHVGLTNSEVAMDNIENAVLNQLVINAYREEARNFSTDSLMLNLNSFELSVEARLKKEFEDKFFTLKNLTSGLKPPSSMTSAIESRNNMIQEAQKVKNELEVSRMKLEKAKIDAEANRMRDAGLTNKVLQEKYIDAIRNSTNRIIITDGQVPVMVNGN